MLNRSVISSIWRVALVCLVVVAPSEALAHSSGLAVSLGSNPIRSTAGVIDLGVTTSAAAVIEAPVDQDLVLTDITLGVSTENDDARVSGFVYVSGSDGVDYGVYVLQLGRIYDDGSSGGSRQYLGASGIRIPAGVSISLNWTTAYTSHGLSRHSIAYTLAGYLAQP